MAEPSFYLGTVNTCPGGSTVTSVAECKAACNEFKLDPGGFVEGSLCYQNGQKTKCRQNDNIGANAALICKKGEFFIGVYTHVRFFSKYKHI